MYGSRLLIPLALAVGALALPAAAGASFQASIPAERQIGLTGTDDAEAIVISSTGSFFRHDQTSPGFASEFDFDTRTPGTQTVSDSPLREIFTIDGEGGDDQIRLASGGGSLQADGGEGDDTIVGGSSHDLILGGLGADFADGRGSRDVLFLGAGDDRSRWDRTTTAAADDIAGGDGDDTLRMIGSDGDDLFRVMGFSTGVFVQVSGVSSLLAIPGIELLDLDLRDGADLLEQELPPQTMRFDVDGGRGDDALDGGFGPDLISGGDGDDFVRGNAGDDLLSGETIHGSAGNDRMTAELWSAVVPTAEGGSGYDVARVILGGEDEFISVFRAAPFVRVQSAAIGVRADSEALVLETGAGDDTVNVQADAGAEAAIAIDGGGDDDTLRGSDGLEWLAGGTGEDTLTGGAAPDRLVGGGDFDVIRARDGGPDAIECQAGSDVVFADLGDSDRLLDGGACELVERAAFAGPAALARVVAPDELRLGSGTVRVPVACSAGARGGCEGTVSLVTADPVVVGGIAAPALLGRQGFALAPGTTAEVIVPVADRDDLVRAGGARPAVQAQVVSGLAQHTTQLPLNILK